MNEPKAEWEKDWEKSFDNAWQRTFGEVIQEKALIETREEWKGAIRLLLRSREQDILNRLRDKVNEMPRFRDITAVVEVDTVLRLIDEMKGGEK